MAGERTEKPSPKRLAESKKKGQSARSTEINSTLVLLGVFVTVGITAPGMWSNLRGTFHDTILRTSNPEVNAETIGGLMTMWMSTIAQLCLPLFAMAALAGIVASVIQVRPAFTPSGITPDFKKLNPAAGIKRMAGPQSAMELGKTLFKVILVGTVGFFVIWPQLSTLTRMDQMEPGEIASYTGALIMRLVFTIIAVLIPMAIADFIFQKRRHMNSLKMSKQDVKDEARQSDVAPEIKAAIKRRARELSRQRMMRDVPTADVIVTNPTHFAVALRYGKDVSAPRVVAKGADLLAMRIREIAEEHEIAIVENAPLARALYSQVDVGQEIPGELFGAVAEVLAFVFRTSRRALSWA